MKIKVKYFSVYKNLTNKDEEDIDLPSDSNVLDLFHYILKDHPKKEEYLESTRFAVNLEFSSQNHILKEGDEVAFIPPICGG